MRELGMAIHAEVSQLPGVSRLEADIATWVRRHLPGKAHPGVRVQLSGEVADVTVDVATGAGRPATAVAEEIAEVVQRCVAEAGLTRRSTTVRILSCGE